MNFPNIRAINHYIIIKKLYLMKNMAYNHPSKENNNDKINKKEGDLVDSGGDSSSINY